MVTLSQSSRVLLDHWQNTLPPSGIVVNESIALEGIQKRACKIIMGRHYSSYDEALQEYVFDFLSDKRDQLSLNFLKSLMESEQLSVWLPPTRSTVHRGNLRNSRRLSIPRVNTTRCRKSPMCIWLICGTRLIKIWGAITFSILVIFICCMDACNVHFSCVYS